MSNSLTGRPIGLSCMVGRTLDSGRMEAVQKSCHQTCDGISNRLLYSRASSESAWLS